MRKIFTWDFPLAVIAGFALSYGATFMLVLRLPAPDIFAISLLTCLLLALITAYRKYVLRALIFLPPLALFIWLSKVYEPVVVFVQEYIYWAWNVRPNPQLERLTVILITFAVTTPVYILIRCHSPAMILMLAGGTLFFGLENAGLDYPVPLFWCFLFTVLLHMAHTAGTAKLPEPDEPPEGGEPPPARPHVRQMAAGPKAASYRIMAALPACLIVVFLAGVFAETDPDPLRFIRDMVNGISLFHGGAGRQSATDVTGVGSEMGGPFSPNGDLLLTVSVPGVNAEGPYLRGSIGTVYDGRRWYGDGYGGFPLGNSGLQGENVVAVSYQIPYTITHVGMRSSRLYLPYNTVSVREPETGLERGDMVWYTGDTIKLLQAQNEGFTYEANAILLNLANYRSPTSVLPGESLVDFRQLPRSLGFRVSELALSLAVYGNDYYNALAIERYLVENFTYNPDMPSTPEDKEFVEYFLFEQKEGYCTYFASAMTVLCRAVGLSARYVDGFAPSRDTDLNGTFRYTDELAHAWCEVYIQGEGWRQFEPTPGFNGVAGPVWFPEPVDNAPSPTPTQQPDMPSPENPSFQPSPSAPQDSSEGDGVNPSFPWKLLTLIVLPPVILFLTWLLLRIRRKRFERMLRTLPYSQKQVKRIYKHILWLVSHARVKPLAHETLGEFADRADEAWPTKIYIMRRVTDVYSKSCYAAGALTQEECDTLKYYVSVLERREYIHLGDMRYYLYKKVLSLL